MKLIFKKDDKKIFFSMLAVYATYAELSKEIKEIIEPPISAIDLIIDKLGNLIINNKMFETNLNENLTFYSQLAKYSLGIGIYRLDYNHLSKFHEFSHDAFFKINLDSLFELLLKDDIEI